MTITRCGVPSHSRTSTLPGLRPTLSGTGTSTRLLDRPSEAIRSSRRTVARSRSPRAAACTRYASTPSSSVLGTCAGAARPVRLRQRARSPSRSRPRRCAISSFRAAVCLARPASCCLAGASGGSRRSDVVHGATRLPLGLVQDVTSLPESGQRRPGGMRKPARRRDHVLERSAVLPLQQGDDLRLLRSAPRLAGALCTLLFGRALGLI